MQSDNSLGFAKTTGRQARGGMSSKPLSLTAMARRRMAATPSTVTPTIQSASSSTVAGRPPLATDDSMLDRRIDFVERQLRATRELVTLSSSSDAVVVYARALDELHDGGETTSSLVAHAGEWVALVYPMTQDERGRYSMRARCVDSRTGALTHRSVPIYTIEGDGTHRRHVGDFCVLPSC